MKSRICLFILIIALISCRQKKSVETNSNPDQFIIQKPDKSLNQKNGQWQILSIKMNDNLNNSIGYKKIVDGPDIGVSSIFIDNDIIFIVDPVDAEVKAINFNGEIINVSNIGDESINKVVVYNNEVIVFSEKGFIYFLNPDLELKYKIDSDFGIKDIVQLDDSLCFYNTLKGILKTYNGGATIIRSCLDNQKNISKDTVDLSSNQLFKSFFGVEFSLNETEDSLKFVSSDTQISLKPNEFYIETYDVSNFYFDSDIFMFYYYDLEKSLFILKYRKL